MIPSSHIFLVGLSGSGKSTVGKILAGKLHRTFIDIDKLIEKQSGRTINDIFQKQGESVFRMMESKAILKAALTRNRPKVIALGGGAFEKSRNRKVVSSGGIAVWLRCSIAVLHQRLKNKTDRPLLNIRRKTVAPDQIEQINRLKYLLKKRQKNYRKADVYVSTTGKTPPAVSSEIIKRIHGRYEAY